MKTLLLYATYSKIVILFFWNLSKLATMYFGRKNGFCPSVISCKRITKISQTRYVRLDVCTLIPSVLNAKKIKIIGKLKNFFPKFKIFFFFKIEIKENRTKMIARSFRLKSFVSATIYNYQLRQFKKIFICASILFISNLSPNIMITNFFIIISFFEHLSLHKEETIRHQRV